MTRCLLPGGQYFQGPQVPTITPDLLSPAIGKAGIRTLAKGLFEPFKAQGVHIASLTVVSQVKPGFAEATAVGEHFWQLYAQTPDA